MVSLKELKKNFSYDAKSGDLIWIQIRRRGASVGDVAGWLSAEGYRCVTLRGCQYKVHQIAWVWMTGKWPKAAMDHINGDKSDNRFNNLREATREQNSYNVGPRKSNKIGLKGVSIKKERKSRPFVAQIQFKKRKISLGYFDSAEEAHAAYTKAAVKLMGQFARTQ